MRLPVECVQMSIQKCGFRAVAALCEGKSHQADARREACFRLRIHVLVCESLKNPALMALNDR